MTNIMKFNIIFSLIATLILFGGINVGGIFGIILIVIAIIFYIILGIVIVLNLIFGDGDFKINF